MSAQPLTAEEVTVWRRRFPTVERCTYLINNSLGAMPATVPTALGEFARLWETKGVEAWGDWLPEVRAVCGLLEGLMGAPTGSVTVHQNVATLTAMVLSTVDYGSGRDGIVLADADWPSHHYLIPVEERRGARPVVVPTDGVAIDAEAFCDAIDERTALVIVSHVLFRSSAVVDVARIAAAARRVGALCLVDGYHAMGHMPVDVTRIGCDFYVGGSVKWLCGGPGVGYLYVRPDLLESLPAGDVGWLGHARPFAFTPEWEPADGALRWLGGTPGMPSLYSAREGYKAITEVTPVRVRATSLALTARIVEGALERGVDVRTPTDAEARAGSVTLYLGDETETVSRRLIDEGIIVDFRPGSGIRVGPHFFNTVQECDRLVQALRR
ncbi:MAG TPA: aminotransferase class V-fold PLP-dependent enzyme [Egibacteraceae bacterium]|nr:aminotransferase class V-fold PLP-dependent enzyme [Egibacteraceae bacterium]